MIKNEMRYRTFGPQVREITRQMRHTFDIGRREFVVEKRRYPSMQDDGREIEREWRAIGEELFKEVSDFEHRSA